MWITGTVEDVLISGCESSLLDCCNVLGNTFSQTVSASAFSTSKSLALTEFLHPYNTSKPCHLICACHIKHSSCTLSLLPPGTKQCTVLVTAIGLGHAVWVMTWRTKESQQVLWQFHMGSKDTSWDVGDQDPLDLKRNSHVNSRNFILKEDYGSSLLQPTQTKEEPLYKMSYAKVLPGAGSGEFMGGFPEESSGTVPCPTWLVPVNAQMAPPLARGEQSISQLVVPLEKCM